MFPRKQLLKMDFMLHLLRGRPKGRPQFLGGEGYPIADVCRLGGEGSEECRHLHFLKNNQDKSLSKTQNFLPFVLLRKKNIT